MIEAVIMLLIYVCILALVLFLVVWVLGQIGVSLPPQVIKILWVIVALVVLLLFVRLLLGGGMHLPALN